MDEPWSTEWKIQELEKLFEEYDSCTKCVNLARGRKNIVFGSGNPDADVVFVGQGPGITEDVEGFPFVGESGKFLEDMICHMGRKREEFWFTNIVMCWPYNAPERKGDRPIDRVPIRDEKVTCANRLYRELYIIDPMLIIPLGKEAASWIMGGRSTTIEGVQGRLRSTTTRGLTTGLRYDVMALWHPAFLLREEPPEDGGYKRGGKVEQTFRNFERIILAIDFLKKKYAEDTR